MSVRARQATVLIVRKIYIRTIREMPSQEPVFQARKNCIFTPGLVGLWQKKQQRINYFIYYITTSTQAYSLVVTSNA